jgi:hypothetical protein
MSSRRSSSSSSTNMAIADGGSATAARRRGRTKVARGRGGTLAARGGCGCRDQSGLRRWRQRLVVWAARSSSPISLHAQLGRPWDGWMERVTRGERESVAERGGGGRSKEIRRRRTGGRSHGCAFLICSFTCVPFLVLRVSDTCCMQFVGYVNW